MSATSTKTARSQEGVQWHQIVALGKLALACNEYLKKGRQVFVEGRLRSREYESKIEGRKQYRTEIVASRVQFLGTHSRDTVCDSTAEVDDSVQSAEPGVR